jgi:outer membrane receptor protein involved in Fe transport
MGARLDHYSTFGDAVSPRFTVIVKPTDSDVIKLMAGRAFRAPSIYELYYNDGGISQVPACASTSACTALQPESIWSGEVEATHHFSTLWTAVASGYASQISNTIELRTAPGHSADVSMYQNSAADIRALGFEAELRRDWRQGWMAAATYSFSYLQYAKGAGLREVPNSPRQMGSLKIAVPLVARALTAMTRLSVEGPRYDRNASPDDPPQQQTSTSAVWDLVFSGELPDWHARYSLGVYNLADWKYQLPVSPEFAPLVTIPQSGRSVVGSLTLAL